MDQILADPAFTGAVGTIDAEVCVAFDRARLRCTYNEKDWLKAQVQQAGGSLTFLTDLKQWQLRGIRPDELPEALQRFVVYRGCAYAFVWYRSDSPALRSFLDRLNRGFKIYPIVYDAARHEFLITQQPHHPGHFTEPDSLLHPVLQTLTPDPMRTMTVTEDVRAMQRQNAAYHGFLVNEYGKNLFEQVVLPRILINFGVGACFFPWM